MTESERAMEERPAADSRARPQRLKEAVRQARSDLAERTGVVIDLRDAEIVRLELLNEELDSLFADLPPNIELFDRGLVPGDPPRLWIDMIAHVAMGRDKRVYRFLQDTRYGRRVLAESSDVGEVAAAVTNYVARRLVERERALSEEVTPVTPQDQPPPMVVKAPRRRSRRWSALGAFILGVVIGAAGLLALAWVMVRH
jgi:hypothetical protein